MKFYDFTAKKMNGIEVKMDEYKGKVLLIQLVNVDLHHN